MTDLREMRQFYRTFQIRDALRPESDKGKGDASHVVFGVEEVRHLGCDELRWSHYRLLMTKVGLAVSISFNWVEIRWVFRENSEI